jgi:hypothetical protein
MPSAPTRASSTSAPNIRWRSTPAKRHPQAKRFGLLGSGIFDSPFSLQHRLRIGAGAFVCGEETALMASVEGKRGTPRPRPPYPGRKRPVGLPDLINNVETFANIAPIIRHGGEWFASIGTEKSKGTKVFALAGKVTNTGLIEVPMGTSCARSSRTWAAAPRMAHAGQGGADRRPLRRLHPRQHLDTPVDYESLAKLGSIMGSGGMIVMDEDHQHGRCGPLLHGVLHGRVLRQVHSLPRRHRPDARPARQNLAGEAGRRTSSCSRNSATWSRTPASAASARPRPTRCSARLRFFRNEYEELLKKKQPAGMKNRRPAATNEHRHPRSPS